MSSSFNTTIERYSFNKNGIQEMKSKSKHGEDWPVVYILNGDKEAYVGETQNSFERMNQHYANINSSRKNLTKINLLQSESFNKSAILDIENMLITHMHADGKFILQNANGGQSKTHDYYQRSEYQNVFTNIWQELQKMKLVNHNLFEIENSDIFKYSPYKELTSDQYHIVENLLNVYSSSIQSNTQTKVVVKGGAGTGKSLIAIYFLNLIANILSNNFDYTDTDDLYDESFYNKTNLIKTIKSFGTGKIGFVVPVPSFRSTVKKLFRSIKELHHINVISASEASRGEYDVLVVDEAHRLKRRNKLTNYGTHDNVNKFLGLPKDSSELDWLKIKAKKLLILFYDNNQTVKESDVAKFDFDKLLFDKSTISFELKSQLRVKGGNDYINFVDSIFTSKPHSYKLENGYDLRVFDNCHEMFEEIKKKNIEYKGLCRMLSGLSFYWRKKARDKKSTEYKQNFDFVIDGYEYCWNEEFNNNDFIINDKYLDNIGCIYTSQGYDLNYAGVILGKDISYNVEKQRIEYHTDNFIDTYSKSDDINKTISNIINAYLVLLTRGIYGTYIYAVDKNLNEYIKSLIIK